MAPAQTPEDRPFEQTVVGSSLSAFVINVGPYKLLRKLDEGGMGEVYLAEDTRLGRKVALKMLLAQFTQDEDRVRRFMREAKAASALNHPNIITIFEIGEANGRHYLTTEFIEGETLRKRMATPLTISQVLDIGLQITKALSSAHSSGIIHRDMKPENVMVRPDGLVKILDFGIAKLVEKTETPPAADLEQQDTILKSDQKPKPSELTVEGMVLGTVSYMSPEQVRGERIDARTDIFSVGIMLYEMISGKSPFVGRTLADKVALILSHEPPPLTESRPDTPDRLQAIVSKALRKDRGSRYQDIAEFHNELAELKQDLEFEQKLEKSGQSTHQSRLITIETRAPIRRWLKAIMVGVAAIILLSAAGLYWRWHRSAVLTEKDSVVLADFANSTGDPVFDDALKQGLATSLQQSPFLNILSDSKVAATLRLMGRPPDQHITGDVARELCQRAYSKAVIAGSIASLGSHYVVGLNAIDCQTGDSLAREQAQAESKEGVLTALNEAATKFRERLGESLSTIKRYDTPVTEATTTSLEALKAFSTGRKIAFTKGDAASIPYYEKAIELDPNFALVYGNLAVAYGHLGQSIRASENARKAFELGQHISEREKYRIIAFYQKYGPGDLEKSNQTCEQWEQAYPREALSHIMEADNYSMMGQWEKAFQEAQQSVSLEPDNGYGYSNEAWSLFALNRPDEVKATVERALAHQLDSYFLRLALYQYAFLKGDQTTMKQELSWGTGRSGEEDWLLSAQSDTEAYFGRLAKAREFSERAIDSAKHADAKETAALWQANAALREVEFGNAGTGKERALAALALSTGRRVTVLVALALARAGDIAGAQRLADSLERDFPESLVTQFYWLPSIHAAIELHNNNAARTVEMLETAEPYELGQCQPLQVGMMYPTYIRGLAFLSARQGAEAAREFQKIIDGRGVVLNFPVGALARLGLARAYAMMGDSAKAKAAYQDFLGLWKDADADLPILKQARTEYAQLS